MVTTDPGVDDPPAARVTDQSGLWTHAGFVRFWAAQSVTLLGSQATRLALPLAAVLLLGASPFEVGLLFAAGQAPFLVVSLPAGVWIDRVRKRPVLIATDLGQAVCLATIPAAAALGLLRLELLYVVAFATGVLTVVSEVANYAFVPALIGREQLLDANGKLQVSHSVTEAVGPGVAGVLVQVLSAPLAILVDAASFVVSALLLRGVAVEESSPAPADADTGFLRQASEGLRALLGHPLLRAIVIGSATIVLFDSGVVALLVLFATRELGLDPIALGVVFAAGGVGAVPGGLLAGRVAARVGTGPAIVGGWLVAALAVVAVPFAAGPGAAALLAGSASVAGVAGAVANVNQWSLRQTVTPDRLQARVTAGHRFFVYGAYPIGSLLGGTLATAVGLRPAILACAVGAVLGALWAVGTPLRSLRRPPLAELGGDR